MARLLLRDGVIIHVNAPNYPEMKVTMTGITDGTSNTILFGERSHHDPVYNAPTSSSGCGGLLSAWGWWA